MQFAIYKNAKTEQNNILFVRCVYTDNACDKRQCVVAIIIIISILQMFLFYNWVPETM